MIASRPGHNLLIADLAFPGLVSVGLEQMNFRSHAKSLRKAMVRKYPRLDGLAVLTEQDRETYREVLERQRCRCGGSPTRCARSSRRRPT